MLVSASGRCALLGLLIGLAACAPVSSSSPGPTPGPTGASGVAATLAVPTASPAATPAGTPPTQAPATAAPIVGPVCSDQRTSASPRAKFHYAVTWDPVNGRMLLFGGDDGTISSELWSYCPATDAWTLIQPTGPGIAPRYNHTMVWDAARERALVFGGAVLGVAGTSNELWAFTPADLRWSRLAPAGRLPPGRGAHVAVWDPVGDRMLMFGGQFGDAADVYADLWSYSPVTNRWEALAATGPSPKPRQGHSAVWSPDLERMLVYGGWEDFRPGRPQVDSSDVWSFDPRSLVWERHAQSGATPPPRFRHAAAWDPARGEMVVFGGCCAPTGWFNDVWAYDPRANSWADRTPRTGSPPYTNRVRAAWDPTRDQMLVFGGLGHCFLKNDLWAYSGRDRSWQRLARSAVPQIRNEGASAVYDEAKQELLLFGGCAGSAPRNEVLAYSLTSGTVRTISAAGTTPAARSDHRAAWDPVERVMYVFGGRGPAGVDGGHFGDLWRFRPDTGEWERPQVTGPAPRPRSDFAAGWDPSRRRFMVFGGFGANYYGDLWAFDAATKSWLELGAAGTGPGPRVQAMGAWMTDSGSLAVYGGWTQDQRFGKVYFKEVWTYEPGSDRWTRYPQRTAQPSLRSRASLVWDATRRRLLMFGGEVVESNDVDRPHLENELWSWSFKSGAWSLLDPAGAPSARYQHASAWDSTSERLIVVGGYGSGFTDEIWEYSAPSNTWRHLR